jgi:hypothetical protein
VWQVVQKFQPVKHSFGAARGQTLSLSIGDLIAESGIANSPPGAASQELQQRFRANGLKMKMVGNQLVFEKELIEEVSTRPHHPTVYLALRGPTLISNCPPLQVPVAGNSLACLLLVSLQRLFLPVVRPLQQAVRQMVVDAANKKQPPNRIIFAGGFCTSPYLQEAIKDATKPETAFSEHERFKNSSYNNCTVDVNPFFTVLKGAVDLDVVEVDGQMCWLFLHGHVASSCPHRYRGSFMISLGIYCI